MDKGDIRNRQEDKVHRNEFSGACRVPGKAGVLKEKLASRILRGTFMRTSSWKENVSGSEGGGCCQNGFDPGMVILPA